MKLRKDWFHEIYRKGKKPSFWKKGTIFCSCLLVFITVYMLILPAITLESSQFSQMAGHDMSVSAVTEEVFDDFARGTEAAGGEDEEISSGGVYEDDTFYPQEIGSEDFTEEDAAENGGQESYPEEAVSESTRAFSLEKTCGSLVVLAEGSTPGEQKDALSLSVFPESVLPEWAAAYLPESEKSDFAVYDWERTSSDQEAGNYYAILDISVTDSTGSAAVFSDDGEKLQLTLISDVFENAENVRIFHLKADGTAEAFNESGEQSDSSLAHQGVKVSFTPDGLGVLCMFWSDTAFGMKSENTQTETEYTAVETVEMDPEPEKPAETDAEGEIAPEETEETEGEVSPEETETIEEAAAPEEIEETRGEVSPEEIEETRGAVSPEEIEETEGETLPKEIEETEGEVSLEEIEETEGEVSPEETEETRGEVSPEEIEETEGEASPEEIEETRGAVSPEEIEETEGEVSPEETEETRGEVSSEEIEETEGEVSPEEIEETEGEVEPEETETIEEEAASEETEEAEGEIAPEETVETGTEIAQSRTGETDSLYPAQSFTAATRHVIVNVDAEAGAFPANTTMQVEDVRDGETIETITDAVETENTGVQVSRIHAVNITFYDTEGQEIEPLIPVQVKMTAEEAESHEEAIVIHLNDEGEAAPVEDAEVVSEEGETHITIVEEGSGSLETTPDSSDEEELSAPADAEPENTEPENTEPENTEPDTETESVIFDAENFSVYAIVYTVDFHYEINGKTVEFSIPGGGFVSLEHIVEVLGIALTDTNAENGAGIATEGETGIATEDAIQLNEVEVSEATKKFVADVESVEFSNPELVWVGKVDSVATVGGLKEANGLEVEYSADLTEEQIAEINAQTVEAGDWALISVLPFTSEESLTVTMKNGDQFVVKVTDASRLTVNFDSLNAVIDANNGKAKFLLYASKDSTNYYLKNDGTTTTTPPDDSNLNNYTWTVYISNRNNHQYYFLGRNGLYLNLNSSGLTSTNSGAVILEQDGTSYKMKTSSRSMGWNGNNNKFYKRDDINPAKFNLFYVDSSNSSGGSSGTPGIVLTDKERQDLETWKNTLAQFNTLTDYNKTAEVVGDGDNRMYKIDLSASSGIMDFYKDVDLGFVLDVSNSMKFPSSLKAIDKTKIMMTQSNLNTYYWSHQSDYNREGCFYIISDPAVTSTIYKVFYDNNGTWKYVDASEPANTTKIYTITDSTVIGKDGYRQPYALYYADDTTDRFTYLKNSVDYAVKTLHKIVKPTEGTDDETANVRLAYNFFCATITQSEKFKDLRDAANSNYSIPLAYNYTNSGTKQNEALYDGNGTIKGNSANEFGWKNGSDQYVILVTDGAPNGPSMNDVRTAAANLKRQYPNVKIITIGLSTKDVEGGSQMLYDIADDVDGDGRREFYEAEKAQDLEYILLKILQSIMAKGTVKGTITDTIDKAFYPVDASGNPLSAGVYNASGKINGANVSDYVANGNPTVAYKYEEFYTLEQVGDNWKITWYNQKIGWDDGLAETGNPWKGTVYVKAKEDYLGGNLIETNDSAFIEPTGLKLVINHQEEPNWRDLVNMPELGYPVPRVNVHNLETKQNSTTFTVYKGTFVTPKEQLEALWNNIPIEEVVGESEDGLHKRTTGASANVGTAGDGEKFSLGSLMSEVAPTFNIDSLIDKVTPAESSASQEFTYTAYGHESGKITVKVERTVGKQTPATHTADTVGIPVEQYKVTFSYKPYSEAERMNGKVKDPTDTDHHNGSAGRGAEETRTIKSENTHTINVFQKGIKITKVDKTDTNRVLPGAVFELFRVDASGTENGSSYGLPAGNYSKVGSDLTADQHGVITINPVIPDMDTSVTYKTLYKPNINVGATDGKTHDTVFYLVEKTSPTKDGVTYAKMPGAIKFTMTLTEDKGPDSTATLYDWTQTASIAAAEYQNGSTEYFISNGVDGDIYLYKIKNGKSTDITLLKVDKTTHRSIGGAKFKLVKNSENVDLTQLTITAISSEATVTPEDYDFNGTSIKVVTVPEGGIRIAGLVDDTYTLQEVAAPAGYIITDSGKTFKTENGAIKNADDSAHTNEATDIAFEVENEPGTALPNTGGPGTTALYLIGTLLTSLAGAGLVMRRKKKAT